jgi:hypothetical protein
VVYNELHALASGYLRSERRDHTLQPTALLNELYVRVFTKAEPITWQNRAHFFAVAAQTLRAFWSIMPVRTKPRNGVAHKLSCH